MTEKLGRYEILEEIGQGGFAIVYRAHDTRLDRLVALKELKPILLADPGSVKDFRQEARNIARLDHPNVVTIYDVYEVQQRLFIVMQLVNGSSLAELIARRGGLSWPKTVEIITAVAAGLDYAHSRGILHRDLKPANILLDSNHRPMLSDFGLAKLIGEAGTSVTAGGGVVGTPHYIAPEVWEGRGTTRQSDIYALGCILYEMLIGEKLFPGETPPAAMMAHFRPLALPHTWPEGVPSDVAGVLATALAEKAGDRYATAAEMAEALTTLVKSEWDTPQFGSARPETGPVSPPILTTKLYPPPTRPASSVVSRPRLIERLNEGLHRTPGLTLISAPAGFGKTTLVSDWLRQSDPGLRTAWLSIDGGDNDPTRFLTYFIAALQQIDPNIGRTVQSMLHATQPQPPPIETLMTTLINEISASFTDARCVFILDDYHLIEAKAIDDALTFLLDHLPPPPGGMHLVIATRDDPHLPLARLRARGQLTELRATDLRFTTSEAAEFLNQVMGLNLSEEDIAALETRTEGWIAGLQLAAISMQGQQDVTRFIKSFTGSHHFILDYLLEEVLEQQPEGIQTFLLRTSILDRLCGPLCDAICSVETDILGNAPPLGPSASGQETLEYLQHANLFIVPLDEERRWYRYHHLFSDLLRQRLRQIQPEQVSTLHQRASEWYEQNRLKDEAVDHALAAGDLVRAGYLVEELAEVLWERGEHVKLMGWLDRLSEEQLSTMPRIGIFHSWILHTTGQEKAAEKSLQTVERMLKSIADGVSPDELNRIIHLNTAQLKGRVSVVRARLAFRKGDIPNIIKFSRKALESLPENDLAWRGMAAMALGDSYVISGDMNPAKKAYSEAIRISKKAGNVYSILYPSCKLGIILEYLGELHQAQEIYRELMTLVNVSGLSQSVMTGLLYALWSEILCHWNDIDNAFQFVSRGVELSEHENDVANLTWIHNTFVKVLFAKRDLTRAKETILKLEKIAGESHMPTWIVSPTAAWKARIWLTEGNLDAAQQWIQERLLNLDDELQFARESENIVLARILVAQGELEDAINLLNRLIKKAEAGDRITRLIEMLLVLALALKAQGDTDKAMTALERALTLAEPGGFIRIFVDEGPPMEALLRRMKVENGKMEEYVRKLLAAFADKEFQPPSLSPQSLVEPLSERELEVLQLLTEGLTNQEIGSRLFLSLNTVKVHTRNIYGKLDAHNRTQAVAQARALGILPPSNRSDA